MSATFLQSKAAVVGEGCKCGRCFFCFTFYLPRMFFNSALQPLLLKDSQKGMFFSGFSKWAIPVSQEPPPPNPLQKHPGKRKTFFFSCNSVQRRKRSLGHEWEVETQDWIISGLGVFFHPKFWETNRTGVRQVCSLEGLPEDWGWLESPWEDNQGQEPPNTRSRCPTLQMTNWGSNRGQFCH